MKELTKFITEIRKLKTQDEISERIQSELHEIKQSFLSQKPKEKEWKSAISILTFLSLMGYSIDIGLPQIIYLLGSNRYSCVRVGWLAVSMIFPYQSDTIHEILPIIKEHLTNFANDPIQCLALGISASIFDADIRSELLPLITITAANKNSSIFARRKAMLLLSSFHPDSPSTEMLEILLPTLRQCLVERTPGLALPSATLVRSLMESSPGSYTDFFRISLDTLLDLLLSRAPSNDLYYDTPSPWLILQLIRILQLKPQWSEDEKKCLEALAMAVFSRSGETLQIRAAYSYLIVFSELIDLVSRNPISEVVMAKCTETLVRYLYYSKPQVLNFALSSLHRLFYANHNLNRLEKSDRKRVYLALQNSDQSVSMSALSLLYLIGNKENCQEIVMEIMDYVPRSPFCVRERLCDTAAQLAEMYCDDAGFFVDAMISLLACAGEFASERVWKLVCKKIEANEEIREKTVNRVLETIHDAKRPSEHLMKLAVFIVGEYLSANPLPNAILFMRLFDEQTDHVKSMIITTLGKLTTRFPEILGPISEFFEKTRSSQVLEVSQRATEYLILFNCLPGHAKGLICAPKDFSEENFFSMIGKIREITLGTEGTSTFAAEEEDISVDKM